MIISHRGKGGKAGENTIAAFEEAFAAGADGIECDLRPTGDGQVMVYHDAVARANGKRLVLRKASVGEIQRFLASSEDSPPTLDELFGYVAQKSAPFFMELKSASSQLVETVVRQIAAADLWDRVHLIGFPWLVRNAVRAQARYPRLQAMHILGVPWPLTPRVLPQCSGVFLGWLDPIRGSEWAFHRVAGLDRLQQLRETWEQRGMTVRAGVINRPDGFRLFQRVGIQDFVTDDVVAAARFFKAGASLQSEHGANPG